MFWNTMLKDQHHRKYTYLHHLRSLLRLRQSYRAITYIYLQYRTIKGIMTILFICKLEEVGWWEGQVEILALNIEPHVSLSLIPAII